MPTLARSEHTLQVTCPACNLPVLVPYTITPGPTHGRVTELEVQADPSHLQAHIRGHQMDAGDG